MQNKYLAESQNQNISSESDLVKFGLQFLPDQFEENQELADYYFDLAENNTNLTTEQKSFCLDVSLYCQDSYPDLFTKEMILEKYKELFVN